MEQKTTLSPLIYMAFAMALIILIGIVTLRKPEYTFAISTSETHALVMEDQNSLSPAESRAIAEARTGGFRFIDLRNAYDFHQGTVAGALNLPTHSLLLPKAFDQLRSMDEEGATLVLFGHGGAAANGPWMVLRQLGFARVKVLEGGYSAYQAMLKDSGGTQEFVPEEMARYSYQDVVDSLISAAGQAVPADREKVPEKVVPVKKARSSAVEGGC
ncbi:MAG TPA: rhodanese-like domain-containing protein [Bacteroidales bacterium]|nr:rhodanese-like domain-containing protein [Bacteroidales bacterium]